MQSKQPDSPSPVPSSVGMFQPQRGGMFIVIEPHQRASSVGAAWARILGKPQGGRQRQLPLHVRNERREGCLHADWNVVCKQDGSPLPSTLLPRREEREKCCALRIVVQACV